MGKRAVNATTKDEIARLSLAEVDRQVVRAGVRRSLVTNASLRKQAEALLRLLHKRRQELLGG